MENQSSQTSIPLTPFNHNSHHASLALGNNTRESHETIASDLPLNLRPITQKRQILVLISSFMTIVLTIGLNQAYGVFQSYYISDGQTILSRPKSGSSKRGNSNAIIAFVGTLSYGLTWSGSILISPLLTRLSPSQTRLLTLFGSLLMTLSLTLASFSTKIVHLLLTQGLLFGIGSSLLYYPLLSAAPEYFNSHRGAAMGFILSGAGVGGLLFAPLIRSLLSTVGPRWTLRILSLLTLSISIPIALTVPPSRVIGRRPTHLSLSLLRRPTFVFSVLAGFLQASGNGLPLTFLPEYSVALGYTAAKGAVLLAVMNGVNSISRVLMGWVGDKVGRQNVLIGTVIAGVICVAGLWGGSIGSGGEDGGKQGIWIAFVVLYGVAGGGYNALFPTVSPHLKATTSWQGRRRC